MLNSFRRVHQITVHFWWSYLVMTWKFSRVIPPSFGGLYFSAWDGEEYFSSSLGSLWNHKYNYDWNTNRLYWYFLKFGRALFSGFQNFGFQPPFARKVFKFIISTWPKKAPIVQLVYACPQIRAKRCPMGDDVWWHLPALNCWLGNKI